MASEAKLANRSGCHAMTRNGKPCRAPAVRDMNYCSLHLTRNRAAELGRKGGRRNRIQIPEWSSEDITPPKNAADLARMMSEVFALTRAGQMSPSVGASLAYQANTLMKCLELANHETRIATLEARNREVFELAAARPTLVVRVPTDEELDRQMEEEYGKVSTGAE